ncbi:MAG TPA: (2Fe-2S)-binding protein [Thermotogota bacterium]|nr:(2Fe-2S)-binding protein [Thermotogota bacterium]
MNDDKTIVCRCEDIDIETIRKLIEQGVTSLEEIKRITRCGMGPCQGKTCGPVIAREIAMKTGQPMEEILSPRSRPPFGGVLFQEVLEGIDDEE